MVQPSYSTTSRLWRTPGDDGVTLTTTSIEIRVWFCRNGCVMRGVKNTQKMSKKEAEKDKGVSRHSNIVLFPPSAEGNKHRVVPHHCADSTIYSRRGTLAHSSVHCLHARRPQVTANTAI